MHEPSPSSERRADPDRPVRGPRSRHQSSVSNAVVRVAVAVLALVGLSGSAAAHEGSVHAGAPHWALLAAFGLGLGLLVAVVRLGHGRWADRPRPVLAGLLAGAVLVTVTTVALTELQVDPLGTDPTPVPRGWYPVVAGVVGVGVVAASQALWLLRWRDRPSYAALGTLLGLWVAYPVVVPGLDYWHPLGYGLVLAVPALVGYVVWRDVRPAFGSGNVGAVPRAVGVTAGCLAAVFLLFSTGQFTLNPDEGVNLPASGFVHVAEFADPLVMWPAVEVYAPSVPFFGAMSVGTVVTFALLAALVGTNATLASAVWHAGDRVGYSRGALGGVATTGATACCCCAPAFYGLASAALGLSASPLYWAFIDPSSPLGSMFFVAATGLTTASAVSLARTVAPGACGIAGQSGGATT